MLVGGTSTRRCSDITRCDKATKAETSSTDDANETDDAITKVSRRCRAAGAGPSGASVRARAAAHVTCVRAFARHFDRTARARPAGRGPVGRTASVPTIERYGKDTPCRDGKDCPLS